MIFLNYPRDEHHLRDHIFILMIVVLLAQAGVGLTIRHQEVFRSGNS